MGYTEEYSGKYKFVTQKCIHKPYNHPLYSTWRMMNVRCYDTRHKAYHRYGGRGIEVCEQWRWDNPHGFLNFISDVGDRPSGTTLDKIDNNDWYKPDNVRWADKRTQQNNVTLNDDSGIREAQGRLEVVMQLLGNTEIIGIFKIEEKDKAIERYNLVKKIKMEKSDYDALNYVLSVDEFTPINKRLRINKTSKYYGVSWDNGRHKWRAMISYREIKDGKLINKMIGRFDDEYEAYLSVLATLEWIKKNNFYKKINESKM